MKSWEFEGEFWLIESIREREEKKERGKRIRGEGFDFFFLCDNSFGKVKGLYVYSYFCQVHIKGNSWICKKKKAEIYVIFFWYKSVHFLCVSLPRFLVLVFKVSCC